MRSRGGSKCLRDTFATMLFSAKHVFLSSSSILIILINSRKGDLRAELEKVDKLFFFIATECAVRVVF